MRGIPDSASLSGSDFCSRTLGAVSLCDPSEVCPLGLVSRLERRVSDEIMSAYLSHLGSSEGVPQRLVISVSHLGDEGSFSECEPGCLHPAPEALL